MGKVTQLSSSCISLVFPKASRTPALQVSLSKYFVVKVEMMLKVCKRYAVLVRNVHCTLTQLITSIDNCSNEWYLLSRTKLMIKKELKSLNFKWRKKRQDEDYKSFLFVSECVPQCVACGLVIAGWSMAPADKILIHKLMMLRIAARPANPHQPPPGSDPRTVDSLAPRPPPLSARHSRLPRLQLPSRLYPRSRDVHK